MVRVLVRVRAGVGARVRAGVRAGFRPGVMAGARAEVRTCFDSRSCFCFFASMGFTNLFCGGKLRVRNAHTTLVVNADDWGNREEPQ